MVTRPLRPLVDQIGRRLAPQVRRRRSSMLLRRQTVWLLRPRRDLRPPVRHQTPEPALARHRTASPLALRKESRRRRMPVYHRTFFIYCGEEAECVTRARGLRFFGGAPSWQFARSLVLLNQTTLQTARPGWGQKWRV